MKIAALTLAVIAAALMTHAPSAEARTVGDTYVCRVTLSSGCKASHTDGETTKTGSIVPNTRYASIQWIGKAYSCTSATDDDDGSSDGWCKNIVFTNSTTVTTTWKLGFKLGVSAKIGDITTVTGELNGEYGKLYTDTDTISMTRNVPVGYTDRIYSYVYRNEYAFAFKGYWSKGAGYGCGLFNAWTCYKYTWTNAVAAYASPLVAESGEQTFAFKRYANGSSSGLVIDNDG